MKLVLPTKPDFLRKKLSFTRFALLGVSDVEKQPILAKKKKDAGLLSNCIKILLIFISILSIGFATIIFLPQVYYHFFPAETITLTPEDIGTPLGGDYAQGATQVEKYIPEKNDSLPEGNWLVIPRIGVRTEMLKTETSDEALEDGVWWVPDFGNPGDEIPIILVAHRYGYKWWWKTDYWKYNSFYLLPDLEAGDTIEIISDQRKWTYEVYLSEQGEEITDYSADLILYTCKSLDSVIKHFRYARLINPEIDSQL